MARTMQEDKEKRLKKYGDTFDPSQVHEYLNTDKRKKEYKEYKEEDVRLKNSGNPFQKKRQGMVPTLDRVDYTYQNGVREDSAGSGRDNSDVWKNKDKTEYNRRVGAHITGNLARHAEKIKAEKEEKKKAKKSNLQRYVNNLARKKAVK